MWSGRVRLGFLPQVKHLCAATAVGLVAAGGNNRQLDCRGVYVRQQFGAVRCAGDDDQPNRRAGPMFQSFSWPKKLADALLSTIGRDELQV